MSLRHLPGAILALWFFSLPLLGAPTYTGAGLVLRVSPERSEIVVSMQEIPGFMDAMVMPLKVREAHDLEGLRPGDLVDFTLVVGGTESYAENLRARPFRSSENDPVAAASMAVLEKALATNPAPSVDVGQHVPDFSLTDQNGQPVSLSQFSGKVVAMAFVYTRCQLPNYCIRLSNNFWQLQRRFGRQMGQQLVLLTITLDPAIDQPDVLAKYARTWHANTAAWHFLMGPSAAIARVTGFFGVVYSPDEGMMAHSLHTVVVDRKGNLVANLEGNEFTAQQLGDLVETVMNGGLAPANSPR